ncbi:hypothetical protein LTR09_000846 [Extremus antarcticus]|uniref:Uncharacterized protein n=1 Tax=Extremus antarcticus TaxID=702011 RepID=A0AAJ0LWJ1_9PEZI|nr:hypothetical protein LTR09_000846 [Extremus antarcticus]
MSLAKQLPFLALVASVASFAIPQSAPAASAAVVSVPAVAAVAAASASVSAPAVEAAPIVPSGSASAAAASVPAAEAAASVPAGSASAVPVVNGEPSTTFLVGASGVVQPSGAASLVPPPVVVVTTSTTGLPKRPKTLLENSSTTIIVQVSSSIAPAEPTANVDFCKANVGLTQQGWVDGDLGGFLKEQSQEFLLKGVGIQDAMKQLAGGIGNYACGFDQQCEITGALSDACDATPQPVGVLIGMANFNNFFRSVDARINQIRASITNRLPDIANKFVPVDKFAPPPALADKKASLALTAIGTYGALLPGFAGVFARLFSVMSTSVPVIAGQAAPVEFDPDFNNFADVSKSVGAVFDALSANLRDFVQGRLDAVPDVTYRDSASELPSILFEGDFASATPNLGDLFQDDLMSVIGSFLVNQFWNDARTIVVKATQADFAEGSNSNICEGDNIFPASVKFCDGEGNAYILQTPPTVDEQSRAGLSAGALTDQTLFDTPGFSSIGEFNLDVETITQTAVRNQEANGYGGVPSNQDFSETIANQDPNNLSFKNSLFFNMPVCDLSKTTISSTNENACKFRFEGEDLDKCLFSMKIMCGCQSSPPLTTGDVTDWPYDLADGGSSGFCNVF